MFQVVSHWTGSARYAERYSYNYQQRSTKNRAHTGLLMLRCADAPSEHITLDTFILDTVVQEWMDCDVAFNLMCLLGQRVVVCNGSAALCCC